MSQPLLDVPQTDTVGVKKAGTAMAEIVETDFFQSVVFQYNLEMLCDEVWFDQFAHCIYIDIIQIFFAVGCAAYLLIDKLLLFQAPQQFFKWRDQRQCPVTGLCFRSVLLYGDVLAIHIDLRNGVLYADCLFFKVNRIPFQSDYIVNFYTSCNLYHYISVAQRIQVYSYAFEAEISIIVPVNRNDKGIP